MDSDKIKETLETSQSPMAVEFRELYLSAMSAEEKSRFFNDYMKRPPNWNEGHFTTSDNTRLRHVFSLCANPKGLVVFLQGRGQSIHEHYDFINRMNEQGYAVFSFDRRSHGGSDNHFNDDRTDHHIPDIMKQVGDVCEIISAEIERSSLKNLPRFLVGHSMGGAEAFLEANNNPNKYKGVIYLQPMWALRYDPAPATHQVLKYSASLLTTIAKITRKSEDRVFNRPPWSMQIEKDKIRERKSHDLAGAAIQPAITTLGLSPQTGTFTWGMVEEAIRMTKSIQNYDPSQAKKIPSLVLLAKEDLAVDTPIIAKLSKKFGIEVYTLAGRHQTLNEIPSIQKQAYKRIFDFMNNRLPTP